jgi:HEAT repeat protein
MPRRTLTPPLLLLAALALPATPALAQVPPPPPSAPPSTDERVSALKKLVLEEGGTRGRQAASELFLSGTARGADLGLEGSHDQFLGDVLKSNGAVDQRLQVVNALGDSGRFRARAACELVREALDDLEPRIVALAVQTFPMLDDERGTVYGYLRDTVGGDLRRARPGTVQGREALGLLDAIERMPNPITAVGVLVSILEERQLARGLEERVRDGLTRMTAASRLESPADWRKWYDDTTKRVLLADWRVEVSKRREEKIKAGEREADRYFKRLLVELQGSPDALLAELQKALVDPEVVLPVRRTAIGELGALGRAGNERAERAIALLRARLGQGERAAYDEAKALTIVALGDTGNKALFDDVVPFLASGHPRMRVAAAQAIGALQAPAGIEPLLEVIASPDEPDDLVKVAVEALGRIQANPEQKVSARLRAFAERLMTATSGSAAPANELLGSVARTLGLLAYKKGAELDRGEIAAVGSLLTRLVSHDDTDVRNLTAGSLGTLDLPDVAYPTLTAQLSRETAMHVKRTIVDAMGQQAIDHPVLITTSDIIPRLVGFLNDPDENLKGKARRRLEDIASKPASFRDSLVGLSLIVHEILAQNASRADLAVPFLLPSGEKGLPPPEAVRPEAKRAYYDLLGVRADGRLESDPAAALADYEALIRGLDLGAPTTPTARRLHLGRAKAMLRLVPPRARDALGVLAPCFPNCEDTAELWPAVFVAAEGLKDSENPQALQALLAPFAPFVPAASLEVQARWAALVNRAAGGGTGTGTNGAGK